MHYGEIPRGFHVCHKCDNRKCIRPEHLFIGKNADNVRDRTLKGRSNRPIGEKNVKAVLTEKDVREIKILIRDGFKNIAIAAAYGASALSISKIKSGRTWKHI